MKICHVTASLSRQAGGPFVSVRRLAQCLAALGEEVDVAGLEDESTGKDLPLWEPISPIVCRTGFPRRIGYAKGMRAALDRVSPDLVHTHNLWLYPSLAALNWARRSARPHIVSPRGTLEPWALHHHAWRKRLVWRAWEKRDIESAAVLHATATEEADNLRALGLKNPIAVIPNGVDVPALREPAPRNGVRTALFISRIHPKKGLLNLVRAWGTLNTKDWRMVIAGPSEGGHEDEVKAAVRAAGLGDRFEFAGPVYENAKWDLYHNADLFVLPTFSENFGIVVAEALASCVPVITTRGTPWRELAERKCGWWIDVGPEPLAAALDEAMRLSPDELRAMGLRGRALVEQHYAWPSLAAQMSEVYRWVLGRGVRPDCVRID